MTPDEHYIRAEQLAGQAAGTFQMIIDTSAERSIDADIRAAWFAEMGVLARLAQVHATLATRTAPAPAYPPPYQPAGAYPEQPVPYPGQPAPAPQSPPAWTPPGI
ncbi:hypothetical protein [Actinoplanes sp. NPDC051411]|uniref:hypothetical protein n=1 Tax=Actinoplanes sp. NPDC051411 TaxID=3155522 RepID=UPI0034150A5A